MVGCRYWLIVIMFMLWVCRLCIVVCIWFRFLFRFSMMLDLVVIDGCCVLKFFSSVSDYW